MAWLAFSLTLVFLFPDTSTVPSSEEIAFVLEIIEQITKPSLAVVESLLSSTSKWDNVARNDFCR
jgi:proteasome activator subunit 4